MAAVNEAQVPSVANFKHILCLNKDRLESLCQAWVGRLEANPPEAVDGQIRYVIGMARILTGPKGRFHQFSKLITDCEFHRGANKTTLEDLQVG
jgi:hypothetical protein